MTHAASPWSAAYERWHAARSAEVAFDRATWTPAYEADAMTIPAKVESDMEALTDRRYVTEEALCGIPALDVRQLATKILIAFDGGREADTYMPGILNDCRRFADDSLTRSEHSEGVGAAALVGNHRGWMNERTIAVTAAVDVADGVWTPHMDAMLGAENLIFNTPAVTDDDVIVRLMMLAIEVASGAAPSTRTALALVYEGMSHFGLGTDAGLPERGHD